MLFFNKNKLLLIYNTVCDKFADLRPQKYNNPIPLVDNDRKSWEKTLLIILCSLLPYFKNGASLIIPPNKKIGISGKKSDGLEMFARSLLGFAILSSKTKIDDLNYEDQAKIENLKNNYLKGLENGTNSKSKYFWGKIKSEQKNCEAGIIALSLLLLQDNYKTEIDSIKNHLEYFFEENIQKKYKKNNWLWLRLWQMLFLYKQRKINKTKIEKALLEINQLFKDRNTWYKDGRNAQHIDYYNAWAFQFYNQCFIYLFGEDFPEIAKDMQKKFDNFWIEYQNFFNSQGDQLIYGRSPIYRFASLSPIVLGIQNSNQAEIEKAKSIAINNINHFIKNKSFDQNGILSFGYHKKNINISEIYSGTGSPYWALKGFSALLLPEKHNFWKYQAKDNTKNKIISLQDINLIISKKNETIILLNGASLNNRYPLKYNKFAYSNICSYVLDNDFPVDNNLLLYTSKDKISFRYKNINCSIVDKKIIIKWQDQNNNFYVDTKISPTENGYEIRHHIESKQKNAYFSHGGFAISDDHNKFETEITQNICSIKNQLKSSMEIKKTENIINIKNYKKTNKNLSLLNKFSATPVISGQIKGKKATIELSINISK